MVNSQIDSVAERKALRDAVSVGRIHQFASPEPAAAARPLGLQQVALAGMAAHDLAIGRDLEPFGHRLLGFNAFRASHKCVAFSLKRTRNIERTPARRKDFLTRVFASR